MTPRSGFVAAYSAIFLVVSLVSTSRVARADDLRLSFSAPTGCPSAQSVEARTLQLLGPNGPRAQLTADAQVRVLSGGYELTLRVDYRRRRAERVLRAKSCQTLAEATAWLVALVVDPALLHSEAGQDAARALSESAAREAEAEPTSPAQADATLDEEAAPVDEEGGRTGRAGWSRLKPPDSTRTRMGLLGGVESQGLAGAHGALGARAGLGVGWWYAELSLGHLFARSRDLGPSGRARFVSQTLALSQCIEIDLFLRILPCLGLIGERTRGELAGPTQGTANTAYWLLARVQLQATYMPVEPLELGVALGLGVSLSRRPRFIADELGEVGQTTFLSSSAQLTVGARY